MHDLLITVVRLSLAFELSIVFLSCGNVRSEDEVERRDFLFTYAFEISEIEPGREGRVWIPLAAKNAYQDAVIISHNLPSDMSIAREPRYSNRIASFAITGEKGKRHAYEVVYRIRRSECRGLDQLPATLEKELDDSRRALFLGANQLVPIGGKPAETLLASRERGEDPLSTARRLYEKVDAHMRYDKSRPGYGTGDAVWACDSRFGNCTDFHSLFISLSRTSGVPAKFEIGFPIGEQRGGGEISGYHCWAFFYVSKHGWVPVDISEADKHPELKSYYFGNLTEDRVAFSTGRDLELVPKQAGGPLNFLVYPYVEIEDEPLSTDSFKLRFSYRDL